MDVHLRQRTSWTSPAPSEIVALAAGMEQEVSVDDWTPDGRPRLTEIFAKQGQSIALKIDCSPEVLRVLVRERTADPFGVVKSQAYRAIVAELDEILPERFSAGPRSSFGPDA